MIKQSLLILFIVFTVSFAKSNDACLDEGSHSDEWWFVPELTWFEIFVGSCILIYTFFSMLPQPLRIIKKRSSMGVSPFFLLLISINTITGFINSTIINYPYMQSCPSIGYDACIPSLLSWGQCVLMMVMYIITFTLFFIFYDDKKSKEWKIVIIYYVFYLLFLTVSIVMTILSVTVIGNCSSFSLIFAHTCGIVGCIIVCIQFLPQIYTTFKNKSSGSLSLVANLSQSVGMVVVIVFMGVSTEQDFSAYLKFIVGSVIQFMLSCMQIYYDYILPKCSQKKNVGEQVQLIEKDEEGNKEDKENDLNQLKEDINDEIHDEETN